MTVLVLAEHDGRHLTAGTRATLRCAEALGGETVILVCGAQCSAVAAEAAAIPGVARVLVAEAPHHAEPIAEQLADVVIAQATGHTHLLAPASSFGKGVMPRVAALLDVQPIAEISAVLDAATFLRPIYAGNAIARVRSHDSQRVITVRTTAFEPITAIGGEAAIESVDPGAPHPRVEYRGAEHSAGQGPELASARIVISGGRGLGSAQNFRRIEQLAARLGAAVGASRAAVDAGYIANDHQVGQSGKIVAPDLYIAVGISGAVQHWAGMKDARVIAAINNDPEAPIFEMADYGLVADAMEALDALDQALTTAEQASA